MRYNNNQINFNQTRILPSLSQPVKKGKKKLKLKKNLFLNQKIMSGKHFFMSDENCQPLLLYEKQQEI